LSQSRSHHGHGSVNLGTRPLASSCGPLHVPAFDRRRGAAWRLVPGRSSPRITAAAAAAACGMSARCFLLVVGFPPRELGFNPPWLAAAEPMLPLPLLCEPHGPPLIAGAVGPAAAASVGGNTPADGAASAGGRDGQPNIHARAPSFFLADAASLLERRRASHSRARLAARPAPASPLLVAGPSSTTSMTISSQARRPVRQFPKMPRPDAFSKCSSSMPTSI
jgi:hypothetical protein